MTTGGGYLTRPFQAEDASAGFACGDALLDEYFTRHAAANERSGVGRTYVLERSGTALAKIFCSMPYRGRTMRHSRLDVLA